MSDFTRETQVRAGKLVRALKEMETRDDGPARAGLAKLRVGLRAHNGVCLDAMPHVSPYLGEEQTQNDRWFFAVATLFALHPQDQSRRESLGGAFAQLRPESDSIEKRFQLLLACDEENLWEQLVQIVSLLKSKSVPVNWYRLLDDLTQNSWDDPERTLQLRWARDFYKPAASPAAASAAQSE